MKSTPCTDRREFLALLGLSFLLLLGGVYLTRAYVMDDALITLRYSFNLARHGHVIWNQADASHPTLGYTTFLWMLINAIPACFTQNKDYLVLCAKLIGLIPLAVIAVLLVTQISRMAAPLPFRIIIVLAIFSQALYGFHANSGMETSLFACLVLLTVCSYAQAAREEGGGRREEEEETIVELGAAHPHPSSLLPPPSLQPYVFGTLAFLTRPEGALVVALLLFWDLRRGRTRQAAAGALCFSLAALLLGLALLTTYGTVLPNAFYVKQRVASRGALVFTLKFLLFVALPYLPLGAYAAHRLKNAASRYCGLAALLYLAYYLTVVPRMNVFSRYQWPVLVLLTYASLPALERLGRLLMVGTRNEERGTRNEKRGMTPANGSLLTPRSSFLVPCAVGLLVLFAATDLSCGLAAGYVATRGGVEEANLIALGKAMAKYRDAGRWMAYRDAGAVCYYSDWNAYDTMGLNNRQIALGAVKLTQVYGDRHTDLIIQNCLDNRYFDYPTAAADGWHQSPGLQAQLSRLGYHYAGRVPILTEGDQPRWSVLLFARDMSRAAALLQDVRGLESLPANPIYQAYAAYWRRIKLHGHSPWLGQT